MTGDQRLVLWSVATKRWKAHMVWASRGGTMWSACGISGVGKGAGLQWSSSPPPGACKHCGRVGEAPRAARWERMVLAGERFGAPHPPTPETEAILKAEELRQIEAELTQLDAADAAEDRAFLAESDPDPRGLALHRREELTKVAGGIFVLLLGLAVWAALN